MFFVKMGLTIQGIKKSNCCHWKNGLWWDENNKRILRHVEGQSVIKKHAIQLSRTQTDQKPETWVYGNFGEASKVLLDQTGIGTYNIALQSEIVIHGILTDEGSKIYIDESYESYFVLSWVSEEDITFYNDILIPCLPSELNSYCPWKKGIWWNKKEPKDLRFVNGQEIKVRNAIYFDYPDYSEKKPTKETWTYGKFHKTNEKIYNATKSNYYNVRLQSWFTVYGVLNKDGTKLYIEGFNSK